MKIMKTVFTKRGLGKVVVVAGAGVASANQSFAALDLTGIAIDSANFEAIALLIIGASVGFWAIKKGIALIGR